MDLVNTCRCCLSQGLHDLHSTYTWFDQKEVYADILEECFNIVLTASHKSSCICSACVASLRAAQLFRRQVVDAEREFLRRLGECQDSDEKPLGVKLEPDPDPASGDDSDNYFLAQDITKDEIKEESEPEKKIQVKVRSKKSTAVKKKGKSTDGWSLKPDVKTITKRKRQDVITAINSLPDVNISIKRRSSNRTKAAKGETGKVNLTWSTHGRKDKAKHVVNLETILKYSNVVPFKNKSILGYLCGYCSATFPDPADLRTHTESKHKIDRLNLKYSNDMTECNIKVDISALQCTICEQKMDSLTVLREHLVKVHDKNYHSDVKDHIIQFKLDNSPMYDCAMCTSRYETFKMLTQHMNKHYCNYTCNKCNSTFITKRSLNAHRYTHIEGSFKCDLCEKVFPSKGKKAYHEKTKHMGSRKVGNCPYCNEPFKNYYQRNQHLIKVHNAESQYKCNICDKTYILKSLLSFHIKKCHLMERNFQCTECGYQFFSTKGLRAHMVKHTGERNFSCEICHKAYGRKYTLKEHMRIHNNDRRFQCDVCAMSFVQKCSLKSHLLSNHGISMAASEITVNIGATSLT